jgi:hypothetical protein
MARERFLSILNFFHWFSGIHAPDNSRFKELAHNQMLQSPNYSMQFVIKSTNVLASVLDIVVY